MDKPLSQERPKPLGDGIGLFIGMYEGVKTSGMDKKHMLTHLQILLAEVKRLQAIETQNEELRKIIDRQHIQLDKYELLLNQGADTNE